MTVSQKQKDTMRSRGLHYVDQIAEVADQSKIPLYMLVAMLEKETGTVRNIYGHDRNGALSGFSQPVNEGNFKVFEWLITEKGMTSNGVGPAQLTFKGFFTDMKAKGLKPWDVHDNIKYGGELLHSYYKKARADGLGVRDSLKKAGTKYNGASAYGDAYLNVALRWKELLGNDDYRP